MGTNCSGCSSKELQCDECGVCRRKPIGEGTDLDTHDFKDQDDDDVVAPPIGHTFSSRTIKPRTFSMDRSLSDTKKSEDDDDDGEKHVMFSSHVSVKSTLDGSEYDRTSIEVVVPSCGICARDLYGDRWNCRKCTCFDICERCFTDTENIVWDGRKFLRPMPPEELAIALTQGYEDCVHHKLTYKFVKDEASIQMVGTPSEKVLEGNLAAAKAKRAETEAKVRMI